MTLHRTTTVRTTRRNEHATKHMKRGKTSTFQPPNKRVLKDPLSFRDALTLHMERHGDTAWSLKKAIGKPNEKLHWKAIAQWQKGTRTPSWAGSLNFLSRTEVRYGLPEGYFARKLLSSNGYLIKHILKIELTRAQHRILRWHLPDDFLALTTKKQMEILHWVFKNVFDQSDFSRYISKVLGNPYSVRFKQTKSRQSTRSSSDTYSRNKGSDAARTGTVEAPPMLAQEMANLVAFKTNKFADIGFRRQQVWSQITVSIKVRHLGLMLGAFVASPKSSIGGLGLDPKKLTLGMLVLPRVWDWFLAWKERKRGFFTSTETNLLIDLVSMTDPATGWLCQNPSLAKALQPIAHLISPAEIAKARKKWKETCAKAHLYAKSRLRDIRRLAKPHRDPFLPVLSVLDAERPLREYRKIPDEVLKRIHDLKLGTLDRAEAVRAFVLLRLGMHLGVRQRNLRELLFCQRGGVPRREEQLRRLLRGELRWNERKGSWEVFIPYEAFKNHYSSFFQRKPFCLSLPNVGQLYVMLEAYMTEHRPLLLQGTADPGTLFVRSFPRLGRLKKAAYNNPAFCDAWKVAIQRYGIYNPYTGRGALKNIAPHGPHTVRDVLATHVLKMTGSFELAAYAIQSTPENVARYYTRFLPHDKSARAAEILNATWEES